MQDAQKVVLQALELADSDRARLAHELILSLDREPDDNVEAAWDGELSRRLQRIESGHSIGRPAADVLKDIRAEFS